MKLEKYILPEIWTLSKTLTIVWDWHFWSLGGAILFATVRFSKNPKCPTSGAPSKKKWKTPKISLVFLATFILEKQFRNNWLSQSRYTNDGQIINFLNLTIYFDFSLPGGWNYPSFRSRVRFLLLVPMQVKLTFSCIHCIYEVKSQKKWT